MNQNARLKIVSKLIDPDYVSCIFNPLKNGGIFFFAT